MFKFLRLSLGLPLSGDMFHQKKYQMFKECNNVLALITIFLLEVFNSYGSDNDSTTHQVFWQNAEKKT